MGNVKSAAGWARDTTLRWLILLMLHGGGCTSSAVVGWGVNCFVFCNQNDCGVKNHQKKAKERMRMG